MRLDRPAAHAIAVMVAVACAVAAGHGAAQEAGSSRKSGPDAAGDVPVGALVHPGAVVAYECDTEAFGMDFTPFKKTEGTIRLTLRAVAAEQETGAGPHSPAGTWQVSGPDGDAHVASIARLVGQICQKDGCPFTLSAKGEAMLWQPAPKSLDKLGEKETLTIAVLKPAPLSISISTFRGRDIVALEKGACRREAHPSK